MSETKKDVTIMSVGDILSGDMVYVSYNFKRGLHFSDTGVAVKVKQVLRIDDLCEVLTTVGLIKAHELFELTVKQR